MPDCRQSGLPEPGQKELESFFWKVRVARDVLNAYKADPHERAKAVSLWALLYHFVHSPQDETAEARVGRLARLDGLAAKEGIASLSINLREFALDIGHEILTSPAPVKKLDRILNGPPKVGRKKRSIRENIEIAADVEKLHDSGVTFAKAYESVASTLGKSRNITNDAVRIIHEREMKDRESATASLVRLVAAGVVKF
jgi:hypothetical protein